MIFDLAKACPSCASSLWCLLASSLSLSLKVLTCVCLWPEVLHLLLHVVSVGYLSKRGLDYWLSMEQTWVHCGPLFPNPQMGCLLCHLIHCSGSVISWHISPTFYCATPLLSPFQSFRGPVNHGLQFPCSNVFPQEQEWWAKGFRLNPWAKGLRWQGLLFICHGGCNKL